ncbi:hypothetical protein WL90_12480 [Burkholderia cenocepacia]|nr:hypothetical protein WL90_12480 [Burkholderia cenocepacia]KWF54986.1 hypothetical protein WL89_22945 [Burkholderia cenocepacia]
MNSQPVNDKSIVVKFPWKSQFENLKFFMDHRDVSLELIMSIRDSASQREYWTPVTFFVFQSNRSFVPLKLGLNKGSQ